MPSEISAVAEHTKVVVKRRKTLISQNSHLSLNEGFPSIFFHFNGMLPQTLSVYRYIATLRNTRLHAHTCSRIYLILVIFARKVKSREVINKLGKTTRNVKKEQKEYVMGHSLQTNIGGALLWN